MSVGDRSARGWTRVLRSGALVVALLLGVVGLPGVSGATHTCDVILDTSDSIRAATDAASSGDKICLEAGTYDEGSASWEIDTPLFLVGLDGSDGVTIDRSAASGTRGLVVSADDVTLRGFTLIGPRPPTGVEYGIKVEFVSGLLVDDVVVRESGRSGIDLHGVDGATFTDVGSHDNAPGVGFAITDSHNVDISGLETSGNAWGGMAIFTSGGFTTAGVSDISVADSSFSDEPAAGLYLQDSGTTGPSGFQGISVDDNTFSENGVHFAQIDKSGALADLGVDTLEVLRDNTFDRAVVTGSEDPAAVTVPAIFSAIQDGVDVSDPANGDDAVFVQRGTYEEGVNVPPTKEGLRVLGFRATVRPVSPPHPGYAFNVRPGDVVIRGFRILGDGPDGDVSAILLGGTAADGLPSVVEGNLIEDVRFGIVLRQSGVTDPYVVEGNAISGARKGVVVGSASKAPDLSALVLDNWVVGATNVGIQVANADGTALHFNRIFDNALGVSNDDSSSLDATHNWWGTPLGALPGQTDGDVDTLLWCLREDCTVQRQAHANNFPPHH